VDLDGAEVYVARAITDGRPAQRSQAKVRLGNRGS